MQSLLSVKDAQELLALQSVCSSPWLKKTAAYNRHLYDITTGTAAEFTKSFEAQTAEAQKFMNLVDSAAKNAPAEIRKPLWPSSEPVAAANNALESIQKAAKQASEIAEANFNAVAATATNAAKTTAARKR